jgi:antitoxin component of RelBE/YafQ-DinJ toxin-antitoxin module
VLEDENILARYEISAYEAVSVMLHIVATDEQSPIDVRRKGFVYARVARSFEKGRPAVNRGNDK